MAGTATLTTAASRKATIEESTVAAMRAAPARLRSATRVRGPAAGICCAGTSAMTLPRAVRRTRAAADGRQMSVRRATGREVGSRGRRRRGGRGPAGVRPRSGSVPSSLDHQGGVTDGLFGGAAVLAGDDVAGVPVRPVMRRRRGLVLAVMLLGLAEQGGHRCDVHHGN